MATSGEEEDEGAEESKAGEAGTGDARKDSAPSLAAGCRQSLFAYCVEEEKARGDTVARGRGKDAKRCTRSRPWSPSAVCLFCAYIWNLPACTSCVFRAATPAGFSYRWSPRLLRT